MKEMLKFEKELNKLRKRGATGMSIFVKPDSKASASDIAKEAAVFLRYMKKNKSKLIV